MVFIAITSGTWHRLGSLKLCQACLTAPSGPRFALVGLWYLLTARPNSTLPKFVACMGVFRTLTCGGWTYVTSTDDHDWHDIFMISYLVATLPWTLGCLALSPDNAKAIKYRKYLAGSFFGTLIPLVYFFIQHKVHKVAGGKTFQLKPGNSILTDWILSIYNIRFLRMGSDFVWCGFRCCYSTWFWNLRISRKGCEGPV